MALAVPPAFPEQAPTPKPKPKSGLAGEPVEEKHKSSRGGRASGATFFEVHGAVPVTWSEDEVATAKAACPALLRGLELIFKPVDPIGGPKGCGSAAPIEVSMIAGIAVQPPATLTCNFANVLHKWASGAVQQAAKAALNDKIISFNNVASYTCRPRRVEGAGRISEHALTNALDISAFALQSGGRVSVSDDWAPVRQISGSPGNAESQEAALSPKATFLRYVHEAACEVFSTALGPDHNALHKDHLHFDHGLGGRYGMCR